MCYNISVKLIMFFSCGAGKSLTLAIQIIKKHGGEKMVKSAAKWIAVWMLWVLVTIMVFIPIEFILTNWYGKFYPTVVAERNELYEEVDQIKDDFDFVYRMRNAEIINGESTTVILNSERFTLNVTFDEARETVTSVKEVHNIPGRVWIVAALVIPTALYVSYSAGKLNINLQQAASKKKTKEGHHN